jgi:hypothetical protein
LGIKLNVLFESRIPKDGHVAVHYEVS